MHWKNDFIETNGGTKVKVEISFDREEDIQKILEWDLKKDLQWRWVIWMSCWRNKSSRHGAATQRDFCN